MNRTSTHTTTMRNIILPILVAGAVTGVADAASGVRIHRLGDPPLPPRAVDTRSTNPSIKPTRSVVKPTPTTTTSAGQNRLPLAPQGHAPVVKGDTAAPAAPAPQPAPTPAAAGRRLPLTPAGFVPQAVQAPAPTPAPQAPAAQVVTKQAPPIAPAPAPAAKPAPAPAPTPAAVPAAQPVQAAPAAPAAKPRRRLPIAPVVVADGSTDLPPVPEALLRH